MSRVKGGAASISRHKKVLNATKGHRGRRSKCYRTAVQSFEKAQQYAYRDRRNKKRDFRGLWIQRINAAARLNNLTYSVLMGGLKAAGIDMDRKVLSDIAIKDAVAFTKIADQAKAALAKKAA